MATGGSGSYTYSVSLLRGLVFDPDTRIIAGTPVLPEMITLTYTASDAASNASAVQTFAVTITANPNDFVTTWRIPENDPTNPNNQRITIPIFTGETYDYTVDWGDGQVSDSQTEADDTSHTYASAGDYEVRINGLFPRIYFNNRIGGEKIIAIDQWGNQEWSSMNNAFAGALNLSRGITIAIDPPNLDSVTDMSGMFRRARAFNQDISDWDVSRVTNMSGMFLGALAFNQDIGTWAVDSVANMNGMFADALAFNQDIGGWNVGSVTDMSGMFAGADAFNQDIGGWNVGNVTEMSSMFADAVAFDQDISAWAVDNVTDMSSMFADAVAFDQDISGWNVGNVTGMSSMFADAVAFDQDISGWNVGNVTDMSSMFADAVAFDQDISGWNVGNVTDISGMFAGADAFNQAIDGWNVGNVTDMSSMFAGADVFNQNIGGWDVSSVITMAGMFASATSFNQNIGGWNVSSVAVMTNMLDGSGLDVPNYNALLIGWSTIDGNETGLQTGVVLGAEGARYCGDAAIMGREMLTGSPYDWTINGDSGTADCSTDASLSALSINPGSLSLTPLFVSTATSYTATVAVGVPSVRVTATATDSLAVITVNGDEVDNEGESGPITLVAAASSNTITVAVTAQDGTTMTTYIIDVEFEADTDPTFGDRMIANQEYLFSVAVMTIELPAASGGNGALTYSLSPDLPLGLVYAVDSGTGTGIIRGIPAGILGPMPFTYTVADDDGDTAELVFTITVAENKQPTAVVGENRDAMPGDTVTLDGSGSSDRNVGDALTYLWTQLLGQTVVLTNEATSMATFTVPSGLPANTELEFRLTVTDLGGLDNTADVTIRVTQPNQRPTADAGPNQDAAPETTVTLDGRASSDEDRDDLTYLWEQRGASDKDEVDLIDPNTAIATFLLPKGFLLGTKLEFRLTVIDPDGLRDRDTVTITVTDATPTNQPPIANAGENRYGAIGTTVTLDGSDSRDPGGDDNDLKYQWEQRGAGADEKVDLTGADTVSARFLLRGNLSVGTVLRFHLTVTDPGGLTDFATVTITAGNPPTAVTGENRNEAVGTTVTLDGSGSSDPDGDDLEYSWRQRDAGAGERVDLTGADTARARFSLPDDFPVDADGTELRFRLTVTDPGGLIDRATVRITVFAQLPPIADAGDAQSVRAGGNVTLDGRNSTDDGTIARYQWSVDDSTLGTFDNPDIAQPVFTATQAGTATVTLRVTDNDGVSGTDIVSIDIFPAISAYTLPVPDTQRFTRNVPVNVVLSGVVTTSGRDVTYALSGEIVTRLGLTLDANSRVLAGTFGAVAYTGAEATYTASDALGEVASVTFEIIPYDRPSFPTTLPDITHTADQSLSVELPEPRAGRFGAPPQIYTLTATSGGALPAGLSFDGDSRTLSGTPTTLGTFSLRYRVDDLNGAESERDFILTIEAATPANQPPTANAGLGQSVAENTLVTLDGSTSSDPDGDALTYAWTQVGPPTVTLTNQNTSMATFTAPSGLTDDVVLTFTLTVTDDPGGLSHSDTVEITVTAGTTPPANRAPTANAGNTQTVNEGASVTLNGSGSTDPEGQPLSYLWAQVGTQTVNLTNETTSMATFTAPSGLTDNALLTFSLIVNDQIQSSALADTVVITVMAAAANQPPIADAGPAQSVAENTLVTLDGSTSNDPDGDALTYLWTQTGGSPTVVLTNERTAAPTFTAPSGLTDDVVLTFTLTVTDDPGGLSHSGTVMITIQGPAPTADAGTNDSVEEGDTVTLTGSGTGTPPLTYLWAQINAGAGEQVILTNETTSMATFTAPNLVANTDLTFQLTVTSGTQSSAPSEVTITVNADNDAPSVEAGNPQTVVEGATVELFGGGMDPEGAPLNYRWTQSNAGADDQVVLINPNTQNPTFIAPTLLTVNAMLTFSLTTNDGVQDSASTDEVVITVTATNEAPTANAGNGREAMASTTVTLNASASTDPEGAMLTYAWMQLNPTAANRVTFTGGTTSTSMATFTVPSGLPANTELNFSLTVTDPGGLSHSDMVMITVTDAPPVNQRPTANAGIDQSAAPGAMVTLDGSTSSDPDGDALTYSWTQVGPSTVTLTNQNTSMATFTVPNGLAASTELTFQVAVDDGMATTTAEVMVTVTNVPPTADAGVPRIVDEGDSVTLDGSGSDDNGDTLTYLWTQTDGPDVNLDDRNIQDPTFTAPAVTTGTIALTFTLTVTDDPGGLSHSDTVTITVSAATANQPPTAVAGDDQNAAPGTTVTLDASGSDDPDGDALTYSWAQTGGSPTVSLDNTDPAMPTFTVPSGLTANTTLTFQVTVDDGTDMATAEVTVTVTNVPPTADAGVPRIVDEGDSVTLDGSGSDDNGDTLTYLWTQTDGPDVNLDDRNIQDPTFTAPAVTTGTIALTFTLTVTDDPGGLSHSDTVTITVTAATANQPPTAVAGDDQNAAPGTTVTLDASGSDDPDGNNNDLGYSWTQINPGTGEQVTFTGETTATPTFTVPSGLTANTTLTFQVTVDDGTDMATAEVTVTVTNVPPTADAGVPRIVDEGDSVTLDGSGSDDNGDTLTYLWMQTGGTPTVVLMGADTARPTFIASELLVTTDFIFSLTVTDPDGLNHTNTVTITVNALPSFDGVMILDQEYEVNVPVDVQLPAVVGGDGTITYTLAPALLPSGLTYDTDMGVGRITGTPDAPFSAALYTYTATDADNDMAMTTFNIGVLTDSMPSISPDFEPDITLVEGVEITIELPGVTGGTPPLSYILSGSLPEGLMFNNVPDLTIVGTPSTTAVRTVVYIVTDGNGDMARVSFTITVEENTTPEFDRDDMVADQTFVLGDSVSLMLPGATGGNGSRTYSLSGALPAGLTFDAVDRTIEGTAMEVTAATEITYLAEDEDGSVGNQTFTITVIPPPLEAPTLDPNDDTGSADDDDITNQTMELTFTGSNALPGAVITVTATPEDSSSQMTEATFTVRADGNYGVDLTLSEGVWDVTAIQTVNGVSSTTEGALEVTVDRTAPTTSGPIPSATVVLDGDTVEVDNLSQYFSDETGLEFERNSRDEDVATAEVTSGNLRITDVGVGSTEVEITATDVAGNESTTLTVEVTVIPPTVIPDLDPGDDTGVRNDDNITNRTVLTFIGSGAQPNAAVTVTAALSPMTEAALTVTADGSGNYRVDLTLSEEGVWDVTAIQTVNGLASTAGARLEVTVDRTAPTFVNNSPRVNNSTITYREREAVGIITVESDNANGADIVSFAVRGSRLADCDTDFGNFGISGQFNAIHLGNEGANYVCVRISDAAGNTAFGDSVLQIRRNTTRPQERGDGIPDLIGENSVVLGSTVTINLSGHFNAGGDSVDYTATVATADSARVALAVDGNRLVVEGLRITTDPVTVTVTAEDRDGQSADQTFDVSVVSELDVELQNPPREIDYFTVTDSTTDIPLFPAGERRVSEVYDITPIYVNMNNTELSGPVTVCLPVAGLARPERLSVYRYGTDSVDWEQLPSALNADGTHVCADVDSFSLFALGFTIPVSDISSGLLPPTGGTAPSGWIIWFAAIAGVVVLAGGASLGISTLSNRRRG